MVVSELRKVGNQYVVTIPAEEVERQGWHEGSVIEFVPRLAAAEPELAEDLARIVDERWERNLPALEYLAGR